MSYVLFKKHFNLKESFRQVLWKLWIFVWWRSCLCFPGSWMGLFFLWFWIPFSWHPQPTQLSFVKSIFWDSQLLEDDSESWQSAVLQHGGFSSSSRSFSAATKWPCPSVCSVGRCRVDHGRFWRESRMWSLMHGKKTEPGGDARWIARTNWREEMWAGMRKCGKLKNRQSSCVKVYSVQRWIKNLNRTFRLVIYGPCLCLTFNETHSRYFFVNDHSITTLEVWDIFVFYVDIIDFNEPAIFSDAWFFSATKRDDSNSRLGPFRTPKSSQRIVDLEKQNPDHRCDEIV